MILIDGQLGQPENCRTFQPAERICRSEFFRTMCNLKSLTAKTSRWLIDNSIFKPVQRGSFLRNFEYSTCDLLRPGRNSCRVSNCLPNSVRPKHFSTERSLESGVLSQNDPLVDAKQTQLDGVRCTLARPIINLWRAKIKQYAPDSGGLKRISDT